MTMKDDPAPAVADKSIEQLSGELIDLLHQSATADELALRLVEAERWPDATVEKTILIERIRRAIALHNRLELMHQRESGMLAMIDSARDLSARLDLKELLRAVVARARNMLGSQVSWLSFYNSKLDLFEILAVDGTHKLGPGQIMYGSDTGIVGLVKATHRPFTTQDYLHDIRFTHDPLLDTIFREEGTNVIVGVPLLWEDDVVGLLYVGDRHHRVHTAQDISILSALATHAAVAIKNARAFAEASTALQSAETARLALEQHVRRVQAAAEAHERITSLLAKGATLSTICHSIAEMLDGDVLVLDEAASPIGCGLLGQGVSHSAKNYEPHGVHSTAISQALRQSRGIGRSVVAYETAEETCRLNAVIGGDGVLGAILLFHQSALDETEVRTFEHCASVVGVLLLSHQRAEALRNREQVALLRALLSPQRGEISRLSENAERAGLPSDQPLSLLAIETEEPDTAYVVRRLRDTNFLPSFVFDDVDGVIIVLCATRQIESVRIAITDFVGNQLGSRWRGVLSRPVGALVELPGLYAMLRRALPVLRRIGIKGQIVDQNELALYSTLFETHDQSSLGAFLKSVIGPLANYDEKRGTQLRSTLLIYFDTKQNATLVAKRLGVHVNTVHQRLTTIEALLGSWGQAARMLELHMALRLWHLGVGAVDALSTD